MTAKNDHTGDLIISKSSSENYRNGWDLIFGNEDAKPKFDEILTSVVIEYDSKEIFYGNE